jgi:hypothetical protein
MLCCRNYSVFKFDRKSLRVCAPLSIFAVCIGFIQEMFFIKIGILAYPRGGGGVPPLWLINPALIFFLGGFGGLLSYISGEAFKGVNLF